MNIRTRRHSDARLSRRAETGAALVVGLLLLLVLTLLAISGMSTSTLELQMAGNQQYAERSFQAAEIGIEQAFHSGEYNTSKTTPIAPTVVKTGQPDQYTTTTTFDPATGVTAVPSGGFSMGVGTGFSAYHFNITSTGNSARDAQSVNVQSFYVVGPTS